MDLPARRRDIKVEPEEIERRRRQGPPTLRPNVTPWQALYRRTAGRLSSGACVEDAAHYRRVVDIPPRHNR
jgi:xylonate dehydratase